jgi:hypothetical protein
MKANEFDGKYAVIKSWLAEKFQAVLILKKSHTSSKQLTLQEKVSI